LALVFVAQKFTVDAMPDGWSALMVTILIRWWSSITGTWHAGRISR
jgi:hypothetical protein